MRRRQLERADEPHAGCVGSDDEAGDALIALLRVSRREHGIEIGDPGVRDERLGAGEHIAVAIRPRGRAERGDVGSRVRLRHRKRRHRLALDGGVDPAAAHRAVLRQQDRHGAERLECEHGVGKRRCGREGLADQAAGAPVLVRDRVEPAGRAQLGEYLPRLAARTRVVRRLGERGEVACGELVHALGERHMLVVQERADRRGVDHQLNFGSRLARKASCASRKFGSCISFACTSAS